MLTLQRKSVIDLVRSTVSGAKDLPEMDGETEDYVNDSSVDNTYNGDFEYVNLGPTKIRNLLETEKDKVKIGRLMIAKGYWDRLSASSRVQFSETEAEPVLPAIMNRVSSLKDCVAKRGESFQTKLSRYERAENDVVGSFNTNLIDWEMLVKMQEENPLPESDYWF